ncbi:MAG: hypothetical protein SNJ63_03215 [Sphingomonadaceae bacterium]
MTRMEELEAEAARARAGIAMGLADLAVRLEPRAVMRASARRAKARVTAETDALLDATGLWVRANTGLMLSAAALLGVLAAIGFSTRRRVIPVEQAYTTEDPQMHPTNGEESDTIRYLKERAEGAGEALGQTYYRSRSRAAELSVSARDRAAYAADAVEDAAVEAAAWTKRQTRESPMASVIVGFALGAILAALLPRGRRG